VLGTFLELAYGVSAVGEVTTAFVGREAFEELADSVLLGCEIAYKISAS
jgi:hypothetical protein